MKTAIRNPAAALPLPPMPLGLSQPARHVVGAGPMAGDSDDADDREADEDRILDDGDADLGAGGDADTDDSEEQHHESDGRGDADIGPDVPRVGAKDRQHRGTKDLNAAHRGDDVAGHHQPADHEPEVRVDGAADPRVRGAAVLTPQVEASVGVRDDEHRHGRDDDDRSAAVTRGRRQRRHGEGDADRRRRRRHADHRVFEDPDGVLLEPSGRCRHCALGRARRRWRVHLGIRAPCELRRCGRRTPSRF